MSLRLDGSPLRGLENDYFPGAYDSIGSVFVYIVKE